MICDEQGLASAVGEATSLTDGHSSAIGREMFAVDGCKMPSNASKEWSGTHADLKRKQEKMDKAIRYLMDKQQIETLKQASAKIQHFLASTQDKPGKEGRPDASEQYHR